MRIKGIYKQIPKLCFYINCSYLCGLCELYIKLLAAPVKDTQAPARLFITTGQRRRSYCSVCFTSSPTVQVKTQIDLKYVNLASFCKGIWTQRICPIERKFLTCCTDMWSCGSLNVISSHSEEDCSYRWWESEIYCLTTSALIIIVLCCLHYLPNCLPFSNY